VGGLSTEVDFSRSGAAQTLMGSQVSVVVKPQLESALNQGLSQRRDLLHARVAS